MKPGDAKSLTRSGLRPTCAALLLDSNQSLLNSPEHECGARLFNRTGSGVELSETDLRLFPQVKTLLADVERLEIEIHGEAREQVQKRSP